MWSRVRDSYWRREGEEARSDGEEGINRMRKKKRGTRGETRTNQSVEEVDESTSFVLHGDSDGRDVGDEDG